MHLSKHHYAIELAKFCKKVYFLNPPYKNGSIGTVISTTEFDNIYSVKYKPFFNHSIRFHIRPVFDFFIWVQIKLLLSKLKEKIDIVWCFEPNIYSNLKHFNANISIFHPVDQIQFKYQINVAKSADIIFSVSKSILSKILIFQKPTFFVNHGVSDSFFIKQNAVLAPLIKPSNRIRVGYIGNLYISSLDRECLNLIIQNFPDIIFEFWGAKEIANNNLSGDNSEKSIEWVEWLENKDNVILNGALSKIELAKAIKKTSVFLVCLDNELDKNNGANSHKILEYLSTGKVVVSKPIQEYENSKHLIEVTESNDSNEYLALFEKVISNLDYYNSEKLIEERIKFACKNTYQNQLLTIVDYLLKLN